MPISSDATGTTRGAVSFRDRWEVVREELRQQIITGALLPGERILETEVAEVFGVSRGPVRDALKALETDGLVVRVPRRGSYVTPLTAQDVDEVYGLRECVETYAMERAIIRHPVDVERRLRDHLEAMRDALRDDNDSEVVEEDIAFHTVFYRAADNSRLLQVWEGLEDPLRVMVRLTSRAADRDWSTTVQGHVNILEGVADRDVDAAITACRYHLATAKQLVLRFVDVDDVQSR